MPGSTEKPIIAIAKKAVKPDTCKLILHKFRNREYDISVPVDEQQLVWEPEDITKQNNFKYKNPNTGTTNWIITPMDNDLYMWFAEKIMPNVLEHNDFGFISYISIIEYPVGTKLDWHKDSADPYDTATALLILDKEFTGGKLTVEDIVIDAKQGDMVMFNHSQNVWHSVSPVNSGYRTVVAVWFQNEQSHTPIDEDDKLQLESEFDESEMNTYNALL
tara:strand:- start:201 stop:854 length:654 start_codon:yes stop_codon:yes gene_type:complete